MVSEGRRRRAGRAEGPKREPSREWSSIGGPPDTHGTDDCTRPRCTGARGPVRRWREGRTPNPDCKHGLGLDSVGVGVSGRLLRGTPVSTVEVPPLSPVPPSVTVSVPPGAPCCEGPTVTSGKREKGTFPGPVLRVHVGLRSLDGVTVRPPSPTPSGSDPTPELGGGSRPDRDRAGVLEGRPSAVRPRRDRFLGSVDGWTGGRVDHVGARPEQGSRRQTPGPPVLEGRPTPGY